MVDSRNIAGGGYPGVVGMGVPVATGTVTDPRGVSYVPVTTAATTGAGTLPYSYGTIPQGYSSGYPMRQQQQQQQPFMLSQQQQQWMQPGLMQPGLMNHPQQISVGSNQSVVVDPNTQRLVYQTPTGYTAVGLDARQPMAQTLARGELPSNTAINGAITRTRQSLETVQPTLSSQGRRIAVDTDEVLESAQRLLYSKNQDEKLQRLFREAALASKEGVQQGAMAGQMIRSDQYHTSDLARQTFENARDVVLFLIRSGEFRQFWLEVFQLFQTILGDIRERHGSVLQSALKSDVQQGLHVAQQGVQNLAQQSQTQQGSFYSSTGEYINVQPDNFISNYGVGPTSSIGSSLGTGAGTGLGGMNASNLPGSETKNVLSNIGQDLRQGNLGDQALKEDIQMRAERILFTLSSHPQYNRAIENIFTMIDQWTDRMKQLRANPNVQIPRTHLYNMQVEAFNLLAEFIPRQELIDFMNLFQELYYDLQNDSFAQDFFQELRYYITRSIENPTELTDEYRRRQAANLIDRAKALMNSEQMRHKGRFQEIFNRLTNMLNYIRYDTDTRLFSESIGRLAKDFILDEQGRPDIFVAQESLSQLRRIIVPVIQKQLETIPLPIIEGSNEKYDYRIENLTLNGRDILPDNFDLKLVNNMHLGVGTQNRVMSKLKLTADNMRVYFPNMQFFFRRKTMPRIEDMGIADVKLLGTGLNLKISWRLWTGENRPLTIELASVKCFIDRLDIDVKQSNHRLLNRIALKIFGGTIKRRVSQTLVEKIRDALLPINNQLNDFFRREREGHHFRERANSRLKMAYVARTQGTHVPVTQKVKEAVGKVAQGVTNVTNMGGGASTTGGSFQPQYQPQLQQGFTESYIGGDYVNVSGYDSGLLGASHQGVIGEDRWGSSRWSDNMPQQSSVYGGSNLLSHGSDSMLLGSTIADRPLTSSYNNNFLNSIDRDRSFVDDRAFATNNATIDRVPMSSSGLSDDRSHFDMGTLRKDLPISSHQDDRYLTEHVDNKSHPFEETKDILEQKLTGTSDEHGGRYDSTWSSSTS